MNEDTRILYVYFKAGGSMAVRLATNEAIEIAEQWANCVKRKDGDDDYYDGPPITSFAGGLGWGFRFDEVAGVNASTKITQRSIFERARKTIFGGRLD